MKTLRSLLLTVALLALAVVPSFAQTTVNSTTLSAAVTAVNQQIAVASVTNIAVGDLVAVVEGNVVREVMRVRGIASPYLQVTRRAIPLPYTVDAGTHVSGATIYTGARGRFYQSDPAGSCVATAETFLPHISLTTGFVYQCPTAASWYRLDQLFAVACKTNLFTESIDQSCWTADRAYEVIGITEVHTVKEAGGTVTLIPRKQTGTQAAASGALLGTALDEAAAATVETVRSFVLTATAADLQIATGNRLGLDFTDDTPGELAGVVVTFTLAPR